MCGDDMVVFAEVLDAPAFGAIHNISLTKSDLPRLELSIDLEEALIVDVAPLCRAISRMFDLSALDTLVLRGTSLTSFLEDLKHEKFSPMHNVRKIVA